MTKLRFTFWSISMFGLGIIIGEAFWRLLQ